MIKNFIYIICIIFSVVFLFLIVSIDANNSYKRQEMLKQQYLNAVRKGIIDFDSVPKSWQDFVIKSL